MKTAIKWSDLPSIEQPGKICILKSKWYPEFVESMSDHAESILRESGFSDIESHTLPGSLEIPLAARDLLARDANDEIDAILCFGVIVKGDTLHFEMISQESMRGLGTVMHDFLCPISWKFCRFLISSKRGCVVPIMTRIRVSRRPWPL